jgi:predicted HTH domain antitoxin
MQITVELPDDIAQQLSVGQDLSRALLEGIVVEGCRTHRLSDHQAAELLGLSRYELDGFLKEHCVFLDYSLEEFERERELAGRLREKRRTELAAERETQNQ